MSDRTLAWPGDAGIRWFCTGRNSHDRTVPVAEALSYPAVAGRPIGTVAAELHCAACDRRARIGQRTMDQLRIAGAAEVDISALP